MTATEAASLITYSDPSDPSTFITPHAVTWKPTGRTEDVTEYIGRASLVFGIALGRVLN